MHTLAEQLAEALAAAPGPVLERARISTRQPAVTGDLPAITIAIAADRSEELGFGRLLRGSELLPDGVRQREDVVGDRLAGIVTLDVWAAEWAQAETLSKALGAKLRDGREALRARGFAALRPSGLEALERLDGAFTRWRQRLAYRFVFEAVEGGIADSAGVIRRVDVHDVESQESFDVPQSS